MPLITEKGKAKAPPLVVPEGHQAVAFYNGEAMESAMDVTRAVIQRNGLTREIPELADREGVRGILAKMGVSERVDESYRAVLFEGPSRSAVLMGAVMPDGSLRLDRMISTPNEGAEDKLDELKGLVRNPALSLAAPIEIPASAVKSAAVGGLSHRSGNLVLSPETVKEIESKVALRVLASEAMNAARERPDRGAPSDLPHEKGPAGRSR